MGLVLADLLFAGRAGVLHIIEGIDATWYAGATPETESTYLLGEIILHSCAKERVPGCVNSPPPNRGSVDGGGIHANPESSSGQCQRCPG